MTRMNTSKHFALAVMVAGSISSGSIGFAQAPAGGAAPAAPAAPRRPALKLTIPSFPDGAMLPAKYSCIAKAEALRPHLQWSGGPAGIAGFALILHDADAHPGRTATDNLHWLIWNIPADATEIPEGSPSAAIPGAVTGHNSSPQPPGFAKEAAFAPPCAPVGNPHHYTFELLALDAKLDLPATATRDEFMKAIEGHVLSSSAYHMVFNQ
jgi:Raf kinase inhibitor-like YbhB/YbcL family protein